MKYLTGKTKKELLEEIEAINTPYQEIYIPLRPTNEIINKILEKNQYLKKITCPHSLYLQVSKKTFKKLREKNINIQPGDVHVGRPMKHDPELIKRIINEKANGKPVKKIAEDYDVPVRTIYYYLKNGLNE